MRAKWIILIVTAGLTAAACSTTHLTAVSAAPEGILPVYVSPLPAAVLPFQNLTETPEVGERAAAMVSTALELEGAVLLVPEGDVRNALVRHRIRWTNRIDLDEARALANDLGVRHLVMGSVTSWAERPQPAAGMAVRVLDVISGEAVFVISLERSARDSEGIFGLHRPETPGAVMQLEAREIAEAFSLQAPLPGWENLSELDRRRYLAQSRAFLDDFAERISERAHEENAAEISSLQAEVDRLGTESDSWFRAAVVAQAERTRLSDAIAELSEERDRLDTEVRDLRENNVALTERNSALDERIEELEGLLEEKDAEAADLSRRLTSLMSEIRALDLALPPDASPPGTPAPPE